MSKNFKKILIMGNGGSGKSTLARKLNSILAIPVLHLDAIYWTKNMKHYEKKIFEESVSTFIKKEKWIIEGTPMHAIDYRIINAETIIFLDFDRIKCFYRILKRSFLSIFIGYKHKDGCPAININYKTLFWVWKFTSKNRDFILSSIQRNKKIPHTYYIKNKKELNTLLHDAYSATGD